MSYEEYTWERYYEDIFRRQKKKNNALAVELGEIAAKTEELNVALNRVTGSSFWRALAPARKLYRLVKHEGTSDQAAAAKTATAKDGAPQTAGTPASETDALYRQRLWDYEDYYAQWIRRDPTEQKYASYADSGMSRVREAGFHIVYVEDCAGMIAPFDASVRARWLIFTTRKTVLAAGYAERLAMVLDKHPHAVIAYADEDYFYTTAGGKSIHRIEPNFKPDWSPDTLDSFFYIGNIALMRTDAAIRADWYGSKDARSNVYDLFLQVADKQGRRYDDPGVVHIPQVLAHNPVDRYKDLSTGAGSNADIDENPAKHAVCADCDNDSYDLWTYMCERLKDDLASERLFWGHTSEYDAVKGRSHRKRGIKATFISGQNPADRQICYALPGKHRVSVLILSKDHPELVRKLLTSVIERTDYDDLEFIVVDNGSSPENRDTYERIIDETAGAYPHIYIHEPQEFNFSALCNLAASHATGDLYLFMNDDIEAVQKDWLRLMAGYAYLPHVGAVGAKLLYADSDLIQHVGVTSMAIGPSHKLVIFPDDRSYYYGRNTLTYDHIGVTAACLLIEADKFKKSGGFDESFPVAYNDVELCMKLTRLGYVNVQVNGALLYHHESMTRGLDEGDEHKWERLLNEKNRLYQIYPEFLDEDPYYSPNLIGNQSNYLSNFDYGYNNHTKCESVRQIDASELAESPAGPYKISIDFAGIQPKIRLEEPEIIEFRGWSFISGGDNSLHVVSLVLKNNSDGTIYSVDTDPVPRFDLETTFPGEFNNRLCGFECRVLKDDLASGEYTLGVVPGTLNHDLNGVMLTNTVIYTDTRFTVI